MEGGWGKMYILTGLVVVLRACLLFLGTKEGAERLRVSLRGRMGTDGISWELVGTSGERRSVNKALAGWGRGELRGNCGDHYFNWEVEVRGSCCRDYLCCWTISMIAWWMDYCYFIYPWN